MTTESISQLLAWLDASEPVDVRSLATLLLAHADAVDEFDDESLIDIPGEIRAIIEEATR